MDFTYTDEQQAIAELSHRILSEQLPARAPARARAGSARWFADDVWRELAKADLLGIALPEADGGGGYGLLEACLVAEQVGRTVAPCRTCPASSARRCRSPRSAPTSSGPACCPGVIDGSQHAHASRCRGRRPGRRRDGDGVAPRPAPQAVRGRRRPRRGDPAAGPRRPRRRRPCSSSSPDRRRRDASPARTPSAASRSGPSSSTASRSPRRTCSARPTAGPTSCGGSSDRLLAAICATQTGVCEEAARHHRRATCASASSSARSSARSRPSATASPTPTSTPRPSASPRSRRSGASTPGSTPTTSCMVAKFWAAEGGQRVVHAAQHLHGGIGIDLDYPIHRYFRWAKVLELTLGGASPSLAAPRR